MVLLLLSQLFLVGIVLASPLDSSKNENKHIVDVINEAKSTFTARHYPQFDNLSKDELRKLFGNKDGKRKPQKTTPSDYRDLSESSIVDTFDARDNWPKCIEAISDIGVQGNCSASWAFATTASIRDRRCIAGLPSEIPLSADDLLTCCEDCLADPADACSGTDDVSQAFQYFIYQGVVTGGAYRSYKGCRPYQISPTGQVPVAAKKCVKRCQSNYGKQYEDDKNKIADQKVFSLSNAAAKNELLQGGSLVAEFDLYEDFLHYSGGVYRHLIGDFVGKAHAKVIGWGTHGNGQAYWLATFSLGVDWGVNGTFKILAGVNEVNFETSFIAGLITKP